MCGIWLWCRCGVPRLWTKVGRLVGHRNSGTHRGLTRIDFEPSTGHAAQPHCVYRPSCPQRLCSQTPLFRFQSISKFLKWPKTKWCNHCKDRWLDDVSRWCQDIVCLLSHELMGLYKCVYYYYCYYYCLFIYSSFHTKKQFHKRSTICSNKERLNSRRKKVDSEFAATSSVGSVFQMCGAATVYRI